MSSLYDFFYCMHQETHFSQANLQFGQNNFHLILKCNICTVATEEAGSHSNFSTLPVLLSDTKTKTYHITVSRASDMKIILVQLV